MRERVLLSLFFVLHFGSIAVLLAPSRPGSLSMLPPSVAGPVERASGSVVRATWPVARRYLGVTATSQHWTLFAPGPARWFSSIDVIAYFPLDSAGSTAWTADTVHLPGARSDPLPHLLRRRRYRLQYNLGYEESAAVARPVFAQALCGRLRDEAGRAPGGLTLTAEWERIRIPWQTSDEPDLYRQFLGGYTCPGFEGESGVPPGGGVREPPPDRPSPGGDAPVRGPEAGG